jgi:DNA-directed RNA polymerase alpha subunit
MNQELSTIKISQPAHRALTNAGIKTLEQLTQYREEELLSLHGFGPKAIEILKVILEEHGLSFKTEKIL